MMMMGGWCWALGLVLLLLSLLFQADGQFTSVSSVMQRIQMQLEQRGAGGGVVAKVWGRPVDPACAGYGAPLAVAYAWDAPCGFNGSLATVAAWSGVLVVAPYKFNVALDGWTPQRVNLTLVVVMGVRCGDAAHDELGVATVTCGAASVVAPPPVAAGLIISGVGWRAVARLDAVWYALVRNVTTGAWYRPAWLGQDAQWVSRAVGAASVPAPPSSPLPAYTGGDGAAPPSLLVDIGALYEAAAANGDADVMLFLQ